VAEKRLLVLPPEVVRKIDENRGDLSQAEFLSFLLNSCLEGESVAERFVTREAFHEFEQGMKDLMRNFLDFFISYGLELGQRPHNGGGEALVLCQLLQHARTPFGKKSNGSGRASIRVISKGKAA
jgi:hypothetical protein